MKPVVFCRKTGCGRVPAAVCGHGRIEGHPVGFISNNGPIDPAGATKAAQFIQLCNQSGTPIVVPASRMPHSRGVVLATMLRGEIPRLG